MHMQDELPGVRSLRALAAIRAKLEVDIEGGSWNAWITSVTESPWKGGPPDCLGAIKPSHHHGAMNDYPAWQDGTLASYFSPIKNAVSVANLSFNEDHALTEDGGNGESISGGASGIHNRA